MADPAEDIDEGTPAPATASTAPPAAPAPAAPGPDFTSMVRAPGEVVDLQKRLADIQRQKTATNEANSAEAIKRLETDRARMESAYKASAVMPDELKPENAWNADQQGYKYSTDAVQAFGSIGSVFAMLATSFSGLPMEHALNAGAAAINAVHAGDEKAYQRAYDAWQKNTDLAIKRHNIQHQIYNDATNLMNSNINAGRTKMELAATKFGDQKAQALLDAGMDKELFDLFASRNKTALELQSTWDKVNLEHEKIADLRSRPGYNDQATRGAVVQQWMQDWAPGARQTLRYDFVKDYISERKKEKPDYTPDDLLQWGKDAAIAQETGDMSGGGMKPNTPEKAFIADKAKALMDSEGREPTAEERLQWKQDWTTAQTKKSTSSGAQKASAIQEIFDNAKADGKPITMAEATKQYNLKVATPSGNRIDDIDKMIGMFDNGKNAIDRTLALIDKHWRVGMVGYASRGAERLGNIFGSNESDASQAAHDIEYLQTIAPRLMNDASSRGLKAESDKINSIIAGLKFGDTTVNTKRALSEVRELWDKMQQDNLARRSGTPKLPGSTGEPSNPSPASSGGGGAGSKKAPWLNDPIVKPNTTGPRSDLEEEQPAYG